MPKFLEAKLKKEYPNNPHAVYGTLNAIGAMHGNKETKKGAAMEAKHKREYTNPSKRHAPHNPGRIDHVHMHLNTDHIHGETDRGKDKHGHDHDGHVAGTLPEHKHRGLIHHYTHKG